MLILKEAARPRTGAWAWAGSCWATWTAGPASTATAKRHRAAAGQPGEGHGAGGGLGHNRRGRRPHSKLIEGDRTVRVGRVVPTELDGVEAELQKVRVHRSRRATRGHATDGVEARGVHPHGVAGGRVDIDDELERLAAGRSHGRVGECVGTGDRLTGDGPDDKVTGSVGPKKKSWTCYYRKD